MPESRALRLRGWVGSIDVTPAAGRPRLLMVELRLADSRNTEHFFDW